MVTEKNISILCRPPGSYVTSRLEVSQPRSQALSSLPPFVVGRSNLLCSPNCREKPRNKRPEGNVPWIGRALPTHLRIQPGCGETRVRIVLGTRICLQRRVSKAAWKLFTSFYCCFMAFLAQIISIRPVLIWETESRELILKKFKTSDNKL